MEDQKIQVPLLADEWAAGRSVDFLFWVGCAGAFDDRYKKVSRAFAKILNQLPIKYAVLGAEETCTGDPARRAGNEMLYQMQAFTVIETLKRYEVKNIITMCPHCYNIFKNEYPDLGGHYQVTTALEFLNKCLIDGTLQLKTQQHSKAVYHDPCYLGRANNLYGPPRQLLTALGYELAEMPRHRSRSFCCGAGGAQMFKEAETGNKEIFIERTEEALSTGADVIATACPFCMTMITDGLKYKQREEVSNLDIIECVALAMGI